MGIKSVRTQRMGLSNKEEKILDRNELEIQTSDFTDELELIN